jgi:hypothetical protein
MLSSLSLSPDRSAGVTGIARHQVGPDVITVAGKSRRCNFTLVIVDPPTDLRKPDLVSVPRT